ncbi:hypothetical protein [Larkinella terrae]|uniref:Uncharacterized protein n=1 Tax=Larkinella terrae TaxID=2025311 RepID=A0A7K0EQZ6_9BACT|nr:hypothetical protein [Larkinella terrae]MRS63971.1 hypothetical protein [Larkinella terrae]
MKTNKWKLSLLVWSAMFPFSTLATYGLSQFSFMAHWPLVARTFCLTCLLVPYMVFVALPFLNRRFRKWLQSNPSDQNQRILADQSPDRSSETSQAEPSYRGLMTNGTGI